MAVGKTNRLSKVAREFNVGIATIVEFLHKKGFEIDTNPNYKVTEDMYTHLQREYKSDSSVRKQSEQLGHKKEKKESISIEDINDPVVEPVVEAEPLTVVSKPKGPDVKVVGKIDLDKEKKSKTEEKVVAKEEQPVEKKVSEAPVAKEKEEEAPKKVVEKKEEKVPVEKVVEKKEPEHIPVQINKSDEEPKVVGKIDLNSLNQKTRPDKAVASDKAEGKAKPKAKQTPVVEKKEPVTEIENTSDLAENNTPNESKDEIFKPTQVKKLSGPTVIGKIDLPKETPKSSDNKDKANNAKKKKRKRIKKEKERVNINDKQAQGPGAKKPGEGRPAPGGGQNRNNDRKGPNAAGGTPNAANANAKKKIARPKKRPVKVEVSEEDVQKQIKDTLARLTSKGKSKTSKHRRDKRDAASIKQQAENELQELEKHIVKVTEFVSVSELATMMDVTPTQVISSCMSLGLFVSINQRLDAETLTLVAEEFGFAVEFISVEDTDSSLEEEEDDDPANSIERPPIVTVMGHVDHGKTSLLDYVRSANVIAGEAGGITQHIGAYNVTLPTGRQITFLDTPGHEAFTAMRARGAKVTDIAIIIVAADDDVMPQTVEAINHAAAAGIPIVFAINKIDKPGANPDKIKDALAKMNYLVEEWGGKYQSQDISAKNGINIDALLEKVLLEAEMLEVKANPNKRATGTIIESSLDKGRGYVSTILVNSGTLKVGDVILSGGYYGHVKAMFNERNQKIDKVRPSEPALILGLNGAPQAGEKIRVTENEREAKDLANKRQQLEREQGLRTKKHITLDEIGRRIAIGNFQELNVIVKGDVDGSIEALSDSLIKLSTEEIQVNVIHKGVGQISETDIMLAAASNAIVVGFQVRPSMAARRIAEKEEIDIRLYSIIYAAIEEIKSAMEGMLSPEIKEQVTSTLEVLTAFKITKVGTIAGCIVREGKIKRNSKVRIIRDGIVIYTGDLGSLKRFKDDVKEVSHGYECGLNINNFNDIKEGDFIESFEEVEVSRSL